MSTATAHRKAPPQFPFNPHNPAYVYTVRRNAGTGWEVVRWGARPFRNFADTEKVVFDAMDEGQAHTVAQSLHHYDTTARPPAPKAPAYVVTFATLRCAGSIR
jgi:hypothetical protein